MYKLHVPRWSTQINNPKLLCLPLVLFLSSKWFLKCALLDTRRLRKLQSQVLDGQKKPLKTHIFLNTIQALFVYFYRVTKLSLRRFSCLLLCFDSFDNRVPKATKHLKYQAQLHFRSKIKRNMLLFVFRLFVFLIYLLLVSLFLLRVCHLLFVEFLDELDRQAEICEGLHEKYEE